MARKKNDAGTGGRGDTGKTTGAQTGTVEKEFDADGEKDDAENGRNGEKEGGKEQDDREDENDGRRTEGSPLRDAQQGPVVREVELIPVEMIERCVINRKINPDSAGIKKLSESILTNGLLNAIQVVPVAQGKKYMIIAGERRYWACRMHVGWTQVPCIIRSDLTASQALDLVIVDNMEREDLTPLEQAEIVRELHLRGRTYGGIAEKLRRSVSWVARMAAVGGIIPELRELIRSDERFAGWGGKHLELIARCGDTTQGVLLKNFKIIDRYNHNIPDTVGDVQRYLRRYQRMLADALWKLDAGFAGQSLPRCTDCTLRAGSNPTLWDKEEIASSDRCLNGDCYDKKREHCILEKWQKLTAAHGNAALVWTGGMSCDIDVIEKLLGVKKTLREWDLLPAKKTESKAFPGLVIDGEKVGVRWFKKHAGSTQEKNKKSKEKKERERLEKAEIARLRMAAKAHFIAISAAVDEAGETDAGREFEIIGLSAKTVLAAAAAYWGNRKDGCCYQEYERILGTLEESPESCNAGLFPVAANLAGMVIDVLEMQMNRVDQDDMAGVVKILESRTVRKQDTGMEEATRGRGEREKQETGGERDAQQETEGQSLRNHGLYGRKQKEVV